MDTEMQTPYRLRRTLVAAALSTFVLVACEGTEDLDELHAQALDDAAREDAAAAPESGAATPTPGAATAIDPDEYALVFQDEFRGSTLDEALWNTAFPWGPDVVINSEEQYYVDEFGDERFVNDSPFLLNGETLTITASETPEAMRANANEQGFLSGVITTADKFAFTHGYAEARVNLPSGQALWPAFWMLGSETGGKLPQLFVMERDGARTESVFHNYEYVDDAGLLRSPGQFEVMEGADEDLSEGFHTVGVAWSPEELLFLVDGVPRYRIVGADVPDEDMYLVLNLAIGGTWPGDSDASTPRPASWIIDYVRVWQRRDAS